MYQLHVVLATYPHDSDAFTQGYTFFDGHIYEGTGLYGKSSLRKLDPENHSKSLQSFDIPEKYFGEGITHYKDGRGNDRILQITWRERTAFVYDAHSIELLFAFKYHVESSNGEGWGVTHNPNQNEFVVSDGSEYLFFWDVSSLDECELNLETSAKNDESSGPDDFKFCDVVVESKRQIKVHRYTSGTSAAIPIKYLNELEFIPRSTIDGTSTYSIFANVWYQNYLLEICPISGVVLKVYDLSRLCPEVINGEVLNGISVSEESDHVLYVTGKLWSHAHKIRLI
jgi:glutamine cyclotransferase